LRDEFKNTLDLTIFQYRPDDPIAYEGFDFKKDKGYNEYLMISKAVMEKTNSLTHCLKITGRYPMANICQIIKEAESNILKKSILFMGDVKDLKIYDILHVKGGNVHWGDSRFFVFEKSFYIQT
jgi:hypothetical protein